MSESGLRPVGSEQTVPPGHIETEIAVGLAPINGVVYTMHVGCHDKKPEHAIELRRQTDIAVIEHRGGVQHYLKAQHRDWRSAEHEHRGKFDQHRDEDLARVETQ